MVSLNVNIGEEFKMVTCACKRHPLIDEYHETKHCWTVVYACICGNNGRYGMGK